MILDDYIGQSHLLKNNGAIKKMIDNNYLQSLIFYGNPGIGKTTLANILADSLNMTRFNTNATNINLKELKEICCTATFYNSIVLVMDEIHQLNKTGQNFLLPFLEKKQVYLIGTTTENPYFSVNAALRSRLLLFNLKPIDQDELVYGLYKYNLKINGDIIFSQETYTTIYNISGGDVRMSFNILNFILNNYTPEEVTSDLLHTLFETNLVYDKTDSNHYDLLSAFQKSIRASDVDASLHYLARLLKSGDFNSLLRRLTVIAYEDIGLGNPQACDRVLNAIAAFEKLGMPEGRIPLSVCVVDLALSPKSTSAYVGLNSAFSDLDKLSINSIPDHLLYKQPHKTNYTPEIARHIDNLPLNIQGRRYFVSNESSQYEKLLSHNNEHRKKGVK